MSITPRDLKLLWSRAAGRCSICRIILTHDSINGNQSYPVGEQAHVVAESEDGTRGQSILSRDERNSYVNLILLCPTHHREIDANGADYPAERLHILKQAHEMWVLESLQNTESYVKSPKAAPDQMEDFIREWLDFGGFFFVFFNEVDMAVRDSDHKRQWSEEYIFKIKEWHRRREVLRELLYLAGEDNLVLKDVPDWQRLKRQDPYIEEGDYKTPFSFILDFGNPVAMINLHGSPVWSAWHISQKFIEILSWEYPSIKGMRSGGQTA